MKDLRADFDSRESQHFRVPRISREHHTQPPIPTLYFLSDLEPVSQSMGQGLWEGCLLEFYHQVILVLIL